MEELIKKLEDFDPTKYTEKFIEALTLQNECEVKYKAARAGSWLVNKNAEGKPTDKLVEAQVELDTKVVKANAELIVAEGNFQRARLEREDYYEKYQRDKKIADIKKVSY